MSLSDRFKKIFTSKNIYLDDSGNPKTLVSTTKFSFQSLLRGKTRNTSILRKYWDIYQSDLTVFSSINYTSWNTCMSGWSLISDNKDMLKKVQSFVDKVDLNSILLESAQHALIFGDAFVEIIYNKGGEITGLKVVDPKTMFIDYDKYGRVRFYYQEIEGEKGPNIDPKYIMHIRFFPIPGEPYGLSLIAPSYSTIKKKAETEEAIANSIIRHGFPKWKVVIDTKDGKEIPPDTVLDSLKDDFTNINEKTEFILPDIIDIVPLDSKGVEKVEEYYNYFQELLVVGMMCPQEVLGLGSNSTEATSRVRAIMYERMIKSFQNYMARAVEINIFDRITGIPGEVRMRFKGTTEVDEARRAEWIARLMGAYKSDDQKPFTKNEIRQMFGFHPLDKFEEDKIVQASKSKRFVIPFKYSKGNIIEKGDKKIYKNVVLLTEGIYIDSGTEQPHLFHASLLRQFAKNWSSHYLNIDHKYDSTLHRIGYVKNPRIKDDALIADLEITMKTQNGRDIVSLIDEGLVNSLSIEAEIEDKYDYEKEYYVATAIEFTGAAVVVNPACPEAKIKP